MNAKKGVTLPPLAEMLLVLAIFEIIKEAAVRMPKLVSMAMSIVGAIVLGDTIVKTGIISAPTILIIAVSSIALFTVPQDIGVTTLLRVVFCLLGGILGLYGILAGAVFLIRHLSDFEGYGSPYLAPLAPLAASDLKDAFIKAPFNEMKKRPKSIKNINPVRQRNKA
jgi:hypothetical protein